MKRSPSALVRFRTEASLTLKMLGRAFVSAVLWFLLMVAAGVAMLVAGVYVLAGTGWALIAGGAFCISAAVFIRKGLTNG